MNHNFVITINKPQEVEVLNSTNKFLNQMIFAKTKVNNLYSTSTKDLLTLCNLFPFQEIKESPKKVQKQVVNLLLSIHDP